MHNFIESEYFNLYIASTPAIDKFSNEDYVEYLKKDDNEFRVVVADGVSSSLMGGDWAKILVKNVIKSSESGDDFEKFFDTVDIQTLMEEAIFIVFPLDKLAFASNQLPRELTTSRTPGLVRQAMGCHRNCCQCLVCCFRSCPHTA